MILLFCHYILPPLFLPVTHLRREILLFHTGKEIQKQKGSSIIIIFLMIDYILALCFGPRTHKHNSSDSNFHYDLE